MQLHLTPGFSGGSSRTMSNLQELTIGDGCGDPWVLSRNLGCFYLELTVASVQESSKPGDVIPLN